MQDNFSIMPKIKLWEIILMAFNPARAASDQIPAQAIWNPFICEELNIFLYDLNATAVIGIYPTFPMKNKNITIDI